MSSRNRHLARVVALQALYELDCTRHSVADVMLARLEETPLPDDELRRAAYQLVNGVLEARANIDEVIRQYAPDWPLDTMAIIDRNILRMAIYEFVLWDETPAKVAFNEAVDLAKAYGAESASRFVNGVLGALSAHEDALRTALRGGGAAAQGAL